MTLFVPGVLPEHLHVDVSSGSVANSHVPLSIPLPPIADSSKILGTSISTKTVEVKTLFGGTKEISVEPRGASEEQIPKKAKLPFIARTFSHACPTRAPGDATRMHSVLSAFFQGPVTPEERKRRAAANEKCMYIWNLCGFTLLTET